MPLPFQIKNIRRILRKANPDIDDIDFETESMVPDPENLGEYSDWTTCLEEVSFPENILSLEDRYPNINWRLPKEQKIPKGPLKWLKIWQEGTTLCADALVRVGRHKTVDKRDRVLKSFGRPEIYERGRMQITVPKELIGIEAKVHIEFPNAPEIKKRSRRGRKVTLTWQGF
jgi:hypothetical protein